MYDCSLTCPLNKAKDVIPDVPPMLERFLQQTLMGNQASALSLTMIADYNRHHMLSKHAQSSTWQQSL